MLRFTDVSAGYPGAVILSGLHLHLPTGSKTLVTGPNGAGKTTLARLMLGHLAPLSGAVERNFQRIGWVPQASQLDRQYPLSLQDLVEMAWAPKMWRFTRRGREESAARRRLARQALERVGLAGQSGLLFSQASGGQLQRALLARAIVSQPQMLICDEPFSNLDRDGVRQATELLAAECDSSGMTLVVIDHPPELDADRLSYTHRIDIQGGRAELRVWR